MLGLPTPGMWESAFRIMRFRRSRCQSAGRLSLALSHATQYVHVCCLFQKLQVGNTTASLHYFCNACTFFASSLGFCTVYQFPFTPQKLAATVAARPVEYYMLKLGDCSCSSLLEGTVLTFEHATASRETLGSSMPETEHWGHNGLSESLYPHPQPRTNGYGAECASRRSFREPMTEAS